MSDENVEVGAQVDETSTIEAQPKQQEISVDDVPQSLRNKIEANHRKKMQAKLKEAENQLASLTQLRQQVGDFMDLLGEQVPINAETGLGGAFEQVTTTLDSLKTEKEKMATEAAKQTERLKIIEQERDKAIQNLHDQLVYSQLDGILLGENRAKNAKVAELLGKELRPLAKVNDDHSVVFEMEMTDEETGVKEKRELSARDIINIVEQREEYKVFFNPTVQGGTGEANSGRRGQPQKGPSLAELAEKPEEFFKLMQENPAYLNEVYHSEAS